MGCLKAWSDNWLDPAVIASATVSSAASGYPVSNLYDNRRVKKWRSTSATSQFILWDLGLPGNPKGFAAISDRNNPFKITPAATIKLQGNSTNVFTSPEFEQVIPFRDYILALESETGLHTGPLRYWRLTIDDPTNTYGYIELGEVFLGDWIELTRGCAVFPFNSRLNDSSVVFTSEGGQTHASRRSKGQEFKVEWRGLLKGELEELESIFNFYGFHQPFFMSFDSLGSFSTEKETWVRFVRFVDGVDFDLISFNNFSASWKLKEEL